MSESAARLACAVALLSTCLCNAAAADANRLAYLDDFCNPYYVGVDFPKLTTPQWIGEPGVDAVITLGIDDMREPERYEAYLRPILERLKEIDGRAAVSIMTCNVDPRHPQLEAWLAEGLSLETHTIDHPCPCLQSGDFDKAKDTYDRCVDLLNSVPGNRPVAFRFPCCDSQNTPSPRAFAEILCRTTENGNFLQISSSVCSILNAADPSLPRELALDADGRDRFAKYAPFESFVNKVYNYPYPFVIGRLIWEFPCATPDDWQGFNLHERQNPQTLADMQAVVDAAVLKQGVANFVFHPYEWIRSDQMAAIVDYADRTYGNRVKFLTFRECLERLSKNLLGGQPLRAANGQDNGVRLLDVNGDGFLDLMIGNEHVRVTRIWDQERSAWREVEFPVRIVDVDQDGTRRDAGVRFGVLGSRGQVGVSTSRGDVAQDSSRGQVKNLSYNGAASFLVAGGGERSVWHFAGDRWVRDDAMSAGLELDGVPIETSAGGRDTGVRLRDLDGDGVCEVLVAGPKRRGVLRWDPVARAWQKTSAHVPEPIIDEEGRDAGLRFVDLTGDGRDDVVWSNESRYAVYVFESAEAGWRRIRSGNRGDADAIPMIVRQGTNNGAWFAEGHMWVQNEDTHRLPDGVDRRTFAELLGGDGANGVGSLFRDDGLDSAESAYARKTPDPLSPDEALQSFRVRPGFAIELVAAEPLVMDPVAFDWGPDGKLWVVEMADYPLGIDDNGQPGGRVRFLEDTNGDGKYDKSTVFLDKVPFPTGVMAWQSGVLVSAAPDIFYAEDTTGDGRADKRETLYRGFGEGNQQHRVNGFEWGLDNWIYVANGDSGGKVTSTKTGETVNMSGRDVRIRPDEGLIETVTGQSQFGRRRDDWGNWFGNNNIVPLRHFILDDAQLRRNPNIALAAVQLDIARADNTQLFPISRVISHWVGYAAPRAGETHRFTSACSTTFYRDDLFGGDFATSCFTSEPIHNLVHRRVVTPRGVTFTSARAGDEQDMEFVASTDSWFRPTMNRTGPDGAVWIADMVRIVLEHPEWIDDEHEKSLDLRAGHDRGRIYRVFPADRAPRPIPRLHSLGSQDLVAALDSPSGWQRDTAQRLLIERKDSAAIEPLVAMLRSAERPLARLHALCTLDGLASLSQQALARALEDPHAGVRRHAVRLVQQQLKRWPQLGEKLLPLIDDEDPFVQLQLCYAFGSWQDARAGEALGRLAIKHADDEYLTAAALSSLTPENLAGVVDAVFRNAPLDDKLQSLQSHLAAHVGAVGDKQTASKLTLLLTHGSKGDLSARLNIIARLMESVSRRGRSRSADEPWLTEAALAAMDELRTEAEHVINSEADVAARTAAVRLLSLAPAGDAVIVPLLTSLLDPLQPADVQAAALEGLGRRTDASVAEAILDRWSGLSPAQRRAVLDLLLSRESWTSTLLERLERGAPKPTEIGAAHRQRLVSLKSLPLRERAETLFEQATSADRRRVVEEYASMLQLEGSAERGRPLFARHCANCHRAEGQGHDVGASLSTLTDRSPAAILTAVLDPNRAVEDKFLSYIVQTADGKTHTGILAAETSTTVTLRGEEGQEVHLLRTEIEDLRSTGQSLMPEGLEKELSPEDLADVAAYVAQLGPEPKAFEGNSPQVVRPASDGVLMLTAANCRIFGPTLVFEPEHENLGYWQSVDDYAEWTIEIPRTATYAVTIQYACDNSVGWNDFVLQLGEVRHDRNVPPTGTWTDYRHMAFRETEIPAGRHRVVLRPQGEPKGALMDLRRIELCPLK